MSSAGEASLLVGAQNTGMPGFAAVRKLHCRERMDRHRFKVEFEVNVSHPSDGWHAVVADEPSIRIHGSSEAEALAKAKALALRLLADRVEHEDAFEVSDLTSRRRPSRLAE